ncbi:hypothetical protein COW36_06885 [bacterium (Candidatus Blackallbacteria) CG17_big_fil_post_rev_8_21_14_2_50_48_46]|uniref:Uncharacterized protein n=1 Tax=bacterium (Candidatus Blackallbacteria) CG17_big_fil_post_rev_8_21_14_2_50_48_46 TaxID=2014261 RepID=A0A2M7G771_9BACT|nr:MAG: hypothetical protein COW64_05395 [bacterium (Candidatus Blackallbacteria) CG18_big_fil_WC_8_21_14_2_50_49_26]PIW17921.1 MAG: hypothetical protein COW36_06885 [bacterium (Candidatus Blackallbacteria) CG17_big_fil_post_rev_8_21_14_2_50_48_46]PIW45740.1 MAG: hypothetical protein COW20_19065 [bacterium (Candidatus Blackallbacteria) CG13_big_fil_rev_8_21_14_2_50_49_14]
MKNSGRHKNKQERTITFKLSKAEYAEYLKVKPFIKESDKELFLQALKSNQSPLPLEQNLENEAPPPLETRSNSNDPRIRSALERGEIFYLENKLEFVLLGIELDPEQLPEWQPVRLNLLKDFKTAEKALDYYCKNSSKIAKTQQIVLLRKAEAQELGFETQSRHWYTPAHIIFEIYPRIMNAFGDFEYYDELLSRFYLKTV